MEITEADVGKALKAEFLLWCRNWRTMMTSVIQDAVKGMPADQSSLSKLAIAKDLAGVFKDGLGDAHKFSKFVGSVRFSLPTFVLGMATTIYEDNYKNQVASSNFRAHSVYTQFETAYLQMISDMERNIDQTDWFKDLRSQLTNYLRVRVYAPIVLRDYDSVMQNFVRNLIIRAGIVEGDVAKIRASMAGGIGKTIRNVKMLWEASHNHPAPSLLSDPLSMHPSIMFSESGAAYPVGHAQSTQTDLMFLNAIARKSKGNWEFLETFVKMPKSVKTRQDQVIVLAADLECKKVRYTITPISPLGGLGGLGSGLGAGSSIHKIEVVWARKLATSRKPRVTKKTSPDAIPWAHLDAAARNVMADPKMGGRFSNMDVSPTPTPMGF